MRAAEGFLTELLARLHEEAQQILSAKIPSYDGHIKELSCVACLAKGGSGMRGQG